MIYALTAPPMAHGIERDVLLWRDDRAVLVNADDVFATGGRIVCTRADLMDAGLRVRSDGSLGGPAARLAVTLARELNAELDEAITSGGA